MKNLIIVCALIFNAIAVFAQTETEPRMEKDGYISLLEKEITYDDKKKIIYIKTTIAPQKELGFDSYRIYVHDNDNDFIVKSLNDTMPHPKIKMLAGKLEQYTLNINKKPFTGFFRVATYFYNPERMPYSYGGTYLSIYQYNKGKFEKVEPRGDVDLRTEEGVNRPAKPVLYLYPTKEQEINVQIQLTNHHFLHIYPAYNNGWNVVAKPDGTLKNKATNREHYCLYWETEGKEMMSNIQSGFVIKGTETAVFLEEKLAILGLSPKEINEFIIYWLPQMENNPYNAIYFAQSEYEAVSKLDISPQPDVVIRVMMLWQKLEKPMDLKIQNLPEMPIRTGFVAVEWGGTQVHNFKLAN